MAKVAFLTTGILHAPYGDPKVRGFEERIDAVFAGAERCTGFLGFPEPFGDETPIMFRTPEYAHRYATTITTWQDLESVFAFAYNGVHAEALGKRKEWFVHPDLPGYVAWWIADHHEPSWTEIHARFDKLRKEGSSAEAFDFKQPFDSSGQPYAIDRETVKTLIAHNQIRTLIEQYISAWSEADATKRQALLEMVWAEDGIYADPNAQASDRAGLDAIIAGFLKANPDAGFKLKGSIDHHHNHLRFYWLLRFAHGLEIEGMDYAQVSADYKLQKIVGFF